jgi:uncharacterized protein YbcI
MKAEGKLRPGARSEISRRVLELLQGYVGKGPTGGRTVIAGDLVIVVLADQLTKGEHVLAEQDDVALVREMRRTFMRTLTGEIADIVAEETGRPVLTNLVDHSVLPDYAFVACVLEGTTDEPELSEEPGGEEPEPGLAEAQRKITRGMIGIYKEFIGRGPSDAKTYIDGDVVATLLGQTLTHAEQVLADDERSESVRELRRDFQEAVKERASELVADAVGRPVVAFMSDHSIFPDYALEVFLLEGGAGAD